MSVPFYAARRRFPVLKDTRPANAGVRRLRPSRTLAGDVSRAASL